MGALDTGSDNSTILASGKVKDASPNLLAMVPEKRETKYGHTDGKVEFEIPRFRSSVGQWFGRVFRLSDAISITLDEVGTFIWNEIDGNRDVQAIGKKLAVEFGARIDPLYPRLAEFLQSLEKNRFIRYRRGGSTPHRRHRRRSRRSS